MDTGENSAKGEEETYLSEGKGSKRKKGKRNITIKILTNKEEEAMTTRGQKIWKVFDSKEEKQGMGKDGAEGFLVRVKGRSRSRAMKNLDPTNVSARLWEMIGMWCGEILTLFLLKWGSIEN